MGVTSKSGRPGLHGDLFSQQCAKSLGSILFVSPRLSAHREASAIDPYGAAWLFLASSV
jgi:hypothetical protein